MRIVNRFIKGIIYFLIFTGSAINSYLLSVLVTGIVLSIILSVSSVLGKFPANLSDSLWKIHMLSSIPGAVTFFVYITLEVLDRHFDWKYKLKHRKDKHRKDK